MERDRERKGLDEDLIVEPESGEVFDLSDLGSLEVAEGLGDRPGHEFDPHQRWDYTEHGQLGPAGGHEVLRTKPLPGSTVPPEEYRKIVTKYEILADLIRDKAIFVRKPNWIDPPVSAKLIDIYTNPVVTVAAAATNVDVLTYRVPRGALAIITSFGNDLESIAAFNQIIFRILHKNIITFPTTDWNAAGTKLNTLREFQRKLGNVECPCRFPMPLIFRGPGEFIVQVDNQDVVAHDVEARFQGWEYTVEVTSTRTDISEEFLL
jgi:hypothetical protein